MHLCACVSEEGEDGFLRSSSLLSYTLRYVRFAELGTLCQFGLREPMHLCGCVSEEGEDGEGPASASEASSLLSYTLRYVCLAELG